MWFPGQNRGSEVLRGRSNARRQRWNEELAKDKKPRQKRAAGEETNDGKRG